MNRLTIFVLTSSLLLPMISSLAQSKAAPWYEDRANLLHYKDVQGSLKPVKSPQDWARRVEHIRASMELVMGALPEKTTLPLDLKINAETPLRHYTRQHVTFVAEQGDRVPGWLLVPNGASATDKRPAMICLPGSSAPGKDTPAGLTASADRAYAHELAERGYVCIVLDYPLLHTAEYKTDPYALKYDSATMKGIVNHRRGVDVLQSLPFVDADSIGVIGHSLGGHNALFLAVFDERVKAVVSSCGFNVFAKHNGGDVRAWSSRYYMPRIKSVHGDVPAKIPFDFTEVLAALAPRPVFVNAPLHDAPDFEVSGVRDCFTAAIPVYREVFQAEDRLAVRYPDAGHAFPAAERQAAYAFLDKHLRPRVGKVELKRDLVAHWPVVDKALEIPAKDAPQLGAGDFTLSMWMQSEENADRLSGDLMSQYDPVKRRGFHLTLKSNPGATTNQANWRHLQFGIDDDRTSEWRDCGRPGNTTLAFGLAVHEGALYAGTCEPGKNESGHVYRYGGGDLWIDCGSPDKSNSVTALAVHHGKLYAGTGKYRLGGSSLKESENPTLGGRVFRYEGGTRWVDCGQLPETEAVGGLVVFKDQLYASSLFKPAGFFRYEGESRWTALPVPQGPDLKTQEIGPKRVEALTVHDGFIYASSYDGGHVHRFDGKTWTDCGQIGDNTQTYSFAQYEGRLYVGTWRSGRVFRFEDVGRWTDVGRLGEELEVMGMTVHNGRLLAGSLPLAEVYSYEGGDMWKKFARLDHTPDVTYRRAWTMAEHDGQVFCSTLPSGKVFAFTAGQQTAWGHTLSSSWHHVTAVKSANRLTLYVDGEMVSQTPAFDAAAYQLNTDAPLRIGTGMNGALNGRLADVRVYRRTLNASEIETLAKEQASPLKANGQHVKIFVLTGQSNSLGTTADKKEPDITPGQNALDAQIPFFWANRSTRGGDGPAVLYDDSDGKIVSLRAQKGEGADPLFWGPEIGFSRHLAANGAEDFLFVKASRGGGGNSFWLKGSRDDHMYRHVVETVQQAVKAMPQGVTFEIAALLYIQGESDSPAEAAASGERLRTLVENLRKDLPNAAAMKVIIGGIASGGEKSDVVRSQQSALAKNDPTFRYIDTLDLRGQRYDSLHYSKGAKLEIGLRMAKVWLEWSK